MVFLLFLRRVDTEKDASFCCTKVRVRRNWRNERLDFSTWTLHSAIQRRGKKNVIVESDIGRKSGSQSQSKRKEGKAEIHKWVLSSHYN